MGPDILIAVLVTFLSIAYHGEKDTRAQQDKQLEQRIEQVEKAQAK